MRRRKAQFVLTAAAAAVILGFVYISISADSVVLNLDGYSNGTVNAQDGWSSIGSAGGGCATYDHAITDSLPAWVLPSFGTHSLRISNAVTSGCFGDQTFSKSLVDEAGETSATNGGMSGGTRQKHFEAQFDVASTMSDVQPGLSATVSPDRGDGSRQSYVRFDDNVTGIDVAFYDVEGTFDAGTLDCPLTSLYVLGTKCANFVQTYVARGLSRAAPHTVKFVIDYVDGPANDVVKLYIDGNLVHIGTTWEDYYRFDAESAGEQSTRTTDSLLFRTGGTAVPANAGNGFLFDNISLFSGPTPAPVASTVVVKPSNVSTTGFNNTQWFFYNDGSIADGPETHVPDNTLGSFVIGPPVAPLGVGSAQVGVVDDGRRDLATTLFGGIKLGDITDLKFDTYNPSATNGGGSTRSAYLNFNVDFNNSGVYQRRLAFVPSQNGTVVPDSWKAWDAINGGNAKYAYSGPTWPATTTGPHANLAPDSGATLHTWNDLLADYPGIRMLAGLGSFTALRVGEPYNGYAGDHYTENMDKFVFGTASSVTSYDFDPDPIKVHIVKYLDGSVPTSGYQFPMHSSWNAPNLGSGSGDYVLGNHEGGAPGDWYADTSPMTTPADYSTYEVTGGASLVLPTGSCAPGDFQLLGYSVSDVSFADAATQPVTGTVPDFHGLTKDEFVIVWNKTCPTTGTLTVTKNTTGGDGIFTFTGTNPITPFSITTSSYTGSKQLTLPPGQYTITENGQSGWQQTSSTCSNVTVVAGQAATCTIANKVVVPACTDHTPPSVSVQSTIVGPPAKVLFSVKDNSGGSGLQSIVVSTATNVTVSWPPFVPPYTGTVTVTATKINQNSGSVVGLTVKDKCGNTTVFDPADVTVNPGRDEAITISDIGADENLVKIVNAGLKTLRIRVNDRRPIDIELGPDETRIIDVGKLLEPGTGNSITLQGRGKNGAHAAVFVYPGTSLSATPANGHRHRHTIHDAKD